MEPPIEETLLLHFPWMVVRFRCHFRTRSKDARLAGLAWLCGEDATLLAQIPQAVRMEPGNPSASRRNTAGNAAPISWTSAAPRRRTCLRACPGSP